MQSQLSPSSPAHSNSTQSLVMLIEHPAVGLDTVVRVDMQVSLSCVSQSHWQSLRLRLTSGSDKEVYVFFVFFTGLDGRTTDQGRRTGDLDLFGSSKPQNPVGLGLGKGLGGVS